MILTIGMIVKNEEKYLRSCLEAISPILEKIDSELIITDTGSTDSTLEIARAFTDKVYAFAWCNDFSAARNSTLEKAKGEWYMSLDADEIFEDVNGIIEFFNSGEYKGYNSATYIIRSFNDEKHNIYSNFDSFRLTRIAADTRYANRIHESLPLHKPTKRLTSLANHYGYLAENNSVNLETKVQRNLDLLFLELEKDKKNCKLLLEIGQTYALAGRFEPALEHLSKGLGYAKEQKHILLNPLYADTARITCDLKRYSDVLAVTGEYFESKKNKSEIDLQMYFLQGHSYYSLKKYRDAINSYKNYINLYQEYHKGGTRTKDSFHYILKFTDRDNYRLACMNLAHSLMEEGKFDSAGRYLKLIPISDWHDGDRNIENRIVLELNLMEVTENYFRLPELFNQLDEKSLVFLQTIIERLMDHESKRNAVLKVITDAVDIVETDYIGMLKLRFDFYCKHSLTGEAVAEFIMKMKEWTSLYADVICFALHCELDIKYVASKIDAHDLRQLLLTSKFLHFSDLAQLIYQTLERNRECMNYEAQLWLSVLARWALCSDQLNVGQVTRLFQDYACLVRVFIEAVYKEEILNEQNIRLLPKELQTGYYCSKAVESLNEGDKSEYIRYLKRILILDPELKHVVKILLDELKKNIDRTANQTEFEKYAAIVKKNIRQLIADRQLREAAELVNSYEKLCPSDAEIAAFKEKLKKI